MESRHVEPGQIVYQEGAEADAIFVIRQGEVEVLREAAGEPVRLGLLGQGAIFGESGVIRDRPRSTTVRALEPVELIVIPKAAFLATFRKDNPLALALLRMLCERMVALESRLMQQRAFSEAAAQAEVKRIRLLPDSPQMAVQIGSQGVDVAALPFRVGCRPAPGGRATMTDTDLALHAVGTAQISPSHFAVEAVRGRLILHDLESHLGTMVNGQRVAHFEQASQADLHFGENSVIAGGVDSPYRFRIILERAAT